MGNEEDGGCLEALNIDLKIVSTPFYGQKVLLKHVCSHSTCFLHQILQMLSIARSKHFFEFPEFDAFDSHNIIHPLPISKPLAP